MNYLKVLAILSLLFIFCGSVYGAGEADSPDINGVNAVIDDTITVENASLTYDKLITSNNCEEVVIGDNSIWDVPIREGPIVENDNTSIPVITLKGENGNNMSFNNPADVFINESFNFQMVFKNLGDATGFQPYIQLIAPDELTHFTVSYSNKKIVPIKVGVFNESTYDNTTGLYTLRDPFTKKEVHGPANSTFYILQYPLGSFTVDAPDAVLNITSGIGVLEIGKLLNFTVTPVFRYGNSPIDDPVNYPPIYGETVTGWVNPVVVKIDKSSSLNEHETATGSNFPFSYFVNINIANGAKIENITITDVIPSDVMYLGSPVLYDSKGRVIDSSLYTIEEPAGNKTGGKLILKLKEAVGDLSTTSITLKYKAYAPEFDNSTGDNITIINSETGGGVAAASTVDMNYTYVNDTYNASNSYSIYLKSLATQKYSEILTGSGQLHPVVPHNLIVYKIDFEISDYFAFDDLVIYDKFDTHKVGSAQKFLSEYEPVLSIYGKTYELNESYYSVVSLGDIDESVTFYISKFLKDNNISTSLKGGYYTNRSVNQGAMVGSLNFVAKVIIHYSNGSSVVSNDLVINHVKTSATVYTFNTVSDNSYTQLRVPSVTLKKDIIAVNGEIINDTDFYKVYPGQNITFVLDIHFPTGSVNDFIVTDFLPIPLFNLKGFNLVNSTTGVIPKGGYWAYANDSGFLHDENTGKVIVPKIGIDTFNNALSFNFGNTLDNMAHPVDVRLWFTFQVSSEPMADQLNLANLAEMKFKDSIDVVYASSNIVLMLTNEPELKITKYVNDTKILENIENATEVEYNITITNTGHSAAYDIIVADDFVNRTTSNGITKADVKSVSLVYSNGTVVDITAFKDDVFTKGYMIAQLAQNTSCSIIYTVRFSEYLIPKESIVNNVWITNFAAYPNSTNFATNKDKYRDNATIIAKGLNITKEFIGSNVTDNTEILFVGEVGIYKITVNFPDLRVPNLVIKDESYGIKYTNFTITTSDGVTVPEYAYTVTYTPSTAHPEKSYLTIDFNGDLVPAYAKNNQLIVNAYYTVVNNENVIPTGADSVTTSNHASISWTNNTLNSDTVYVDIYQPKIDINKVFEPNIVQGNDEASFTITVTNSGKGTAYNTTITDDLTEFIKTFVNSRSDIGVTILKGNETGKVIFNWNNDVATLNVDELLAGQSVSAKFTFNVKNDVVIGKEFKNIAKVDYYSIFNETKFDEKRNYSNQASSTLHTYDAKVNKTVFNTTIVNGKDKVTVGENVTYNITVILPVGKYNILKVTDTLPEGLKYIDGSIVVYKGNTQNKAVEGKDYTVTVNGNIVELTFASEFADEIIKEYGGKFQAFLNATVLNVNNNKAGAVKTNKAVLTWNTHESTSDAAVGIVEPVIDITKNFNVDNVIGGDVIYFDITVTNSGQSPLFNVTLSDDLSDLISKFVSGSINVTSGGAVVTPTWNNNIVSINIAELGIGKSLTYRFTFKIREDVVISSSYTNTANAIGYSAPSNGRNYTDAAKDSFTTKLPVITKWVVDSSIDNGRDKVTIGEKVIYGVNVTLPVGNYTKLVIKDTLPQGFEYIGAGAFYANGTKLVNGKDWTVNVNNYDITITVNNVHSSDFANGILSINLTARPTIFDPSNNEGAVKVNNVELFLNDKTMGRSSAKVTIVEPTADITKKFNVTEVEGLDHVSFDVIVKNNGKTPLFNVTIFDGLDDFDLFIGQTPSEDNVVIKVTGADGNPIDAKIKWIGSHVEIDVAQLNPGDIIHAKYSFVIRSDIQIGSQYVNMANVAGYSAPDHGRNYYNYDEDTLKTKLPAITKWVVDSEIDNGRDNVTIGEKVIYGVNVTLPVGNYTKLVIKDTLPQGFEYIGAGAFYANGTKLVNGKDWTVNVNNYDITITINNVHSSSFANGVLSINLTARPTIFDPSNKEGAVKVNNVELFLNDKTMGRSSAKVTIVEPTADITKKFNVTEVEGLDHVSFDVIVKNNGKTPLFEVTIIDDLEDLASFIGQTPGEDNVVVKVTDADGNPIDAKIKWIGSHVEIDVAQLNPGDIIHAKYSFVIRSDIQIGSQYVNMANVAGYSAPDHGRIYYNESKDTLKTKMPNISVVKTSDKQKYEYYENATYSIVITNNGNGIAYNITIKDVLPLGLKYTGINSTSKSNGWVVEFDENTRTFTVNGLNLTVGDKFTFTYKVSFDEWEIDGVKYSPIGQNFINSVNVAYVSINGTNPNNRTYTTQTTKEVHVTEADLSVVKNCNNKVVIAGEDIYYTIIITNNGLDTAQNVKLNEYYHSEYLTNLEYSLDGKTWNVYTNPVDLGSINSKASKTVYIRGYLDGSIVDDTILNNTVRVNTTTGELKLDDNEATNIKNVTTLAELHVTKVNITEAIAGKIIKYEIVITNNGPSYARDIILKDIYNDSELTNMLYSLDGQSWTRYDASINIGTLANGQNKTILFEGFIKTTVRGNVVNKAVIGSSTKLRDNSTLEDDVAVNVKGDTTLDITKVANTTLVNPGDVIKYTVQITAGGLSDSLDVILTDNLSEMFFDVSKATYSVNGIDKGVWIGNANLGTISSGMTVNVVITVPVKAYVDVGKLNSITNFASVINSDKKAANDTNIVPINVIDLAVNKTANHQNKTYNYGDNVEYVIEIVNNGPGIATDIIATDNLPEGLKFINANVPGGWTLSISNNKITINGEKLANGEKVLITIIAKAAKSNATLINNIKVNGTGFDSNISNNNDSETVKVTPLVDLAITKVVDNANPLFDSIITYTITVVNNGPDASTDVVVKDIWPANGLKFITSTGTYNPATGIWNVGELGSNEIATLTITAKTTAVGKFENKVSVNGTGYDSNLSNNNASVNITVPDCVILNITKVATGGIVSEEPNKEVIAGEKITYTVIVSNYGPSVATNVYLTDLFNADELLNMEYNSNGNWVKYNNGIALGDIDVNEAVMILFRATVNHSTRGLINNTVKITTDIKDARGNFEANETVKAIDNSTLVINKTSNVDAINPGDLFNYTIVITAEGSSDSLGVILTDKLDQNLLDAQNAVFYVNGNYVGKWNGSYNIGTLKTGNSVTVTIEVKALNSANKDIFNKAIVENEEGFINESNKTVHVNTVDLAINKTSDKGIYKYLDNVIYTIVVTNHGPDDSFNVTVRDMLPNTLRFISASGNYNPVTGIWFIGHLAKGQSATLTITAQAIFPGIITNDANVTGSGYDVNLTNNHDNITITVPDCVILNVNKVAIGGVINITGGIKNVVAGEEVIYQVLVSNHGPSTAVNVVLTDNYQTKDLTVVAYSLDNITWIPYTKGANINLGDMTSGSSILVYFKAMVNASTRGIVHNVVNITTDTDDVRGIFSAEEHVNVMANSTLKVDKTAEIKELNPGDTIHYIITVTAGGSSDSLNIVLKDILDSTLLDVNSATYAVDGVNKGVWTGSLSLGKIATGNSVTVDIWAKVLSSADRDVFNLVNVTSDEHPEGNTSNTTVHVRIVDLAVDKLVNNSVPKYLDMIEYTIVVVNNGPDKSFNVTVGDLLPDGVKFISSNGQYNPDTGVWFVGDLDANESATLKIVVQIIKVGNITNNVNVTGTGHDSNLTNNNDSVSVNVPDCVILDISKVANSTVIVAGENVGYTVVINNYGPSVASDIVLKDIFSSNELLNLQYSLNGVDWLDYNEAINLGNIDVGASVTVYFRAKVNGSVRGDVLNTVNITTSVDDARGNFSDNETVNVMANTTLVVIKDAEIKELNPGDTVHFIVTVIAGGSSDSLNVNLRDILDNRLLDINSAKYSINGGILSDFNGNIYLGNMLTGTAVTVDIWAKVLSSADRDVFNLVNVTSDEHPEGNTSNVSVHVRIVDLAVDKLVNNSVHKYLDMIEYTIVVVNNGPDKSFNVTVGDLLPDGVKFISSNGQYNPDTGVWFVGDLDANESATLKIVVQIIKVGNITNNVNVTGTGHDTNLTNNNDSVSVSVPDCVILDISKVANSTVIVAGENVGYTVTVTNYGPSVATNVVLKDIFNSKELLNLQYSLNGVDWLDYNGSVSLGDINVGANITVYFRAKVNGSIRGDVLNTVNITTGVDDARGNFTANETVNVIANTTLVVIKDAEIKELNPGDTVHFIVTVIAGGSSDSLNVNLNDILDAKLLDVAGATYAVDGVNKGSWTGSIDLGNMLTGTAVTVDIWAKILDTADRDVFNLVNVTSDEHPEGNISNTTVHVRIVDLAVDKLVNNSVPKYLDMIEYTIVVVNNGPDKSFNVTVGDLLPDGVKFICSNGQYNPDTGVWFVGDLDNNESAILKIVVQVIKIGDIINNVNVTGTGHDTNLTNNNASVSVNVPESVLLNITKVANSTIIVAGENVGYTVVINNYGPSVASDVVLKDIFNSKELLNLQYSLNGVDWLDYNGSVSLGDINVGANITVYFRAKVNGSIRGDVLNTVNITTGVDDARGNFTANETVKVIANTTLAVIKDAEIKALNPGDTAHFVITVIAGGSSDSLNVKLEDILDAGLLDVKSATYRINGGNLTDYTQIISLGNMHTGSKIVVDIYAAILGTTGQDIFNCVNVTSDEHPEGNTSNTTIHVNIADLEIIKIVNNATPNYGDEITYTITVRNNGPDNSTNIKVSEVLADNFKFISANASKGYYNLTNGVWAVGNLTNNETAKLVITVKIIKTGFIQNNVSVNGTGFDPNVTNNNATVNITVPQTADLSVVKIVNVDRVSVGNRITYTIVVKNNGPDTALDVYVVDKLSDALKFVSYKASVGVYDPVTGIWTIGNLTNKSNATLEITCIVLKTGVISNEVFVNGSTVDLNMTNNYGNVSVTVIPAPAPVHPADKDIMDSDEVAMGVDAMAKTGNPILALLVVLIFGIFGFGVSRRKK